MTSARRRVQRKREWKEGVKGGGRHRNRLREWKELKQETEAIKIPLRAINRDEQKEGERWSRQAEAGVYVCMCMCLLTSWHSWPSCWPCCCCMSAWGALSGAQGSLHSLPKTQKHKHQTSWCIQIHLCHSYTVSHFIHLGFSHSDNFINVKVLQVCLHI